MTNNTEGDNLYTITEAAEYLGCTRPEVYTYMRVGLLRPDVIKPHVKLFTLETLKACIARVEILNGADRA